MANIGVLERYQPETADPSESRTQLVVEVARQVERDELAQARIERFLGALQLFRDQQHLLSEKHAERGHEIVPFPRVVFVGITPDMQLFGILTSDDGYHRMVVTSWETNERRPNEPNTTELAEPIVYGGSNVGEPTLRVDFLTPDNQTSYVQTMYPSLREDGWDDPETRDYISVADDGAIIHNGLTGENTACVPLEEVLAQPSMSYRWALNGGAVLILVGKEYKLAA